jgi:hypothetical protein
MRATTCSISADCKGGEGEGRWFVWGGNEGTVDEYLEVVVGRVEGR